MTTIVLIAIIAAALLIGWLARLGYRRIRAKDVAYMQALPGHTRPVRLPAEFDTPSGLAALLRHHGLIVEFDR